MGASLPELFHLARIRASRSMDYCDGEDSMDELSGGALRNIETGRPDLTFAADNDAASVLFVINLCASMTPMTVAKALAGFEQYKLYQVSRMEDGRRRFRMRLGFFQDEAAADIVLNAIRHSHPTAFTACLAEEDLRHAPEGHRKLKPKVVAATAVPLAPPATRPAAQSERPPASTTPLAAPTAKAPVTAALPATTAKAAPAQTVIKTASAPATPVRTEHVAPKAATPPSAAKTKQEQNVITLAAEPAAVLETRNTPHDPTKPTATHSAAALTQASSKASGIELARETAQSQPASPVPKTKAPAPFHVAAGVQVPDVNLELANDAPAAAAPKPANGAPAIKAQLPQQAAADAKANRPSLLDKPLPTAAQMAPAPPPVTIRGDMIPVLDSTQTIRTLSAAEVSDENQPKWFVVQLAVSEQPVNLEAMPRLDIFAAYCLYSVAVMEENSIRHALRLGFFKEDVSADAVSGYLKTFFPTPAIIRISAAEHKRFADRPTPKVEARGNVVQIDQARDRAQKPAAPVSTALSAIPAAKGPISPVPSKTAARSTTPKAKHAPMPPKKTAGHMKTGAHRTLGEQLREEARQTVLSQSGVHKPPRQGSLLSRLVDKLKQ
jgi:hypothetical protein